MEEKVMFLNGVELIESGDGKLIKPDDRRIFEITRKKMSKRLFEEAQKEGKIPKNEFMIDSPRSGGMYVDALPRLILREV